MHTKIWVDKFGINIIQYLKTVSMANIRMYDIISHLLHLVTDVFLRVLRTL